VEEYLATVGYQNSVRWSPTGKRSERLKLGDGNAAVHPRLIANFSSMSRKLRSEKREKIEEDLEICFVEKGRR
jgi:hypothetical protein